MINGKTEIYGILGNPVEHSLSPIMHNAAFAHNQINAVYLPFCTDDVEGAIRGFRALGIRGLSVTIPHKQTVRRYVDEVDAVAAKIGAINTVFWYNNHVQGVNTDWIGANRAMADKMELEGKTILLLGAGGSARALGFGFQEAGATVILASRTPVTGKALAETLGCEWHNLQEISNLQADALVNATSVGMGENVDVSLVPANKVGDFPVVMDIVYAPLETRLLREAKAAGCQTINGLAMLLYQGVAQFELWTGQAAPIHVMNHELRTALGL